MITVECLLTLRFQIEFLEKTTIWEEVMWVFYNTSNFTLVFMHNLFTN